MSIWIIEPHDPLIFRDGRPFGPTPGARAFSLPFPFPSTLAGAVRNRAGLDGEGRFQYANDKDALQQLKRLKVRGPFLIERTDEQQNTYSWLLPAPHDALLFDDGEDHDSEQKKRYDLKQIVPLVLPEKALTDLEALPSTCTLAGLPVAEKGKATDGPTYWHWEFFKRWLINPEQLIGSHDEKEIGHQGLERELRVHIAMKPERGAAQDEALFDTSGMEFTRHEKRLSDSRKLALVALVDEEQERWPLQVGLGSFGSERRLVTWREEQQVASSFKQELLNVPEDIVKNIVKTKQCRLVLLTPAYFQQGFAPDWSGLARHGVTPEVRAMVVKRPLVVSGWDMEKREPKPSTRLAPAGSVYYLSLQGSDEDAMRAWVRDLWLQCISDEQPEQFCNDGFGIAVIGTWSDDKPVKMGEKQ